MNFMPFINFILYFFTGLLLLGIFTYVYEKVTPYREFDLIKEGNVAAAIALGGAMLGFVIPLCSAVFFTHSLFEMVKWGIVVGIVQLVTFEVIHRLHGFGDCVKEGRVAGAIFLAFSSISVGMLNAFSISY